MMGETAGWLKKTAGGNKCKKGPSLGALTKKEQRRWFVLNGSNLVYYASSESKDEKGLMTLGSALVEGDESAADFSFVVSSPDRVLALRAESSAELARWLGALKAVCGINVEREQKHTEELRQEQARRPDPCFECPCPCLQRSG